MQPELSELRDFLNEEFKKRKGFKPQYSMRAYSRDLGLAMTSLNGFLSGQRALNLKNINKVFKYLKSKASVSCSWCGKPKQKTKLLIAGPKAQFICKDCVDICKEIIRTGKFMNR